MFQKFLCSFLMLLFLIVNGQGQHLLVVEGYVRFGADRNPVPNYAVGIQSPIVENGNLIFTRTNEEGFYRLEYPLVPDTPISSDSIFVRVQVYDFCSGEVYRAFFELRPDTEWRFVFDAFICQGIDPPLPPLICEAFFSYRQTGFGKDSLDVVFTDLSYSLGPVRHYLWDFGDGENSEEQNPTHRYSRPGIYPVSLMIETDSCVNQVFQEIYVSDREDCVCSTEFNPVCVIDAAGEELQFGNPCMARCAGYSDNHFIRCEVVVGECNCPEYYDPVCVVAGQDTLTFSNHCFAACAGYLPHQLIACYPDSIGPCGCITLYDPVCIITSDGEVLSFSNKCEAECAGYEPAQMVDCNGVEYCQAAFFVEQPDPGGLTFHFMDISRSLNDPVIWWQWDFGDGSQSVEPAPLHTYPEPGVYQVTLSIGTERRCTSKTYSNLSVGRDSTCNCPRIYEPVCVVIDSVFVASFPNACEANCAGFKDFQLVSCDSGYGCPEIYDPVCVYTPGGEILEFPNACYAERSGYGPEMWTSCEVKCTCPAIFDPVCVIVGEEIIQFGNACEAECRGFTPDHFVDCHEYECICPLNYDPVCVILDNGAIKTFSNACQAQCQGYAEDQFVPCDKTYYCDAIYNPVCVVVAGDTLTFTNSCVAELAGYGRDSLFWCGGNDCLCPDIYDPVCVQLPDGSLRSFTNRCEVECAGFSHFPFVVCDSITPCVCPQIFSPVCVVLPDGKIQSFSNACYARCAGFEERQFIDCSNYWLCDCPLEFNPVCVVNDEGVILTLPNPCVAECRGFEADAWVNCEEQGCFANFEIKPDPNQPLTIILSDASRSTEGAIVRYEWDLGDSTLAEGALVSHTFPTSGVWVVTLEITTADGCQARIIRRVLVGDDTAVPGPACQAMFFFRQDSIDRETFQFIDMSIGDVKSWQWDFGDGQYSIDPDPVHRYDQEGVYLVRLTIKGDYCTSTMEMLVITGANVTYDNVCRALFVPFLDTETNAVFFLNLSTTGAAYAWDFGDGNTSERYHTLHTYGEPGSFEVKLTITTQEGCTSHFSIVIDLLSQDFTASPEYFTVSGERELSGLHQVMLYPNPVHDRLWLQFKTKQSEYLEWQMINLDGVVVQSDRLQTAAGENQEEIKVTHLSQGMYFIRLRNDKGMKTFRFVKQ